MLVRRGLRCNFRIPYCNCEFVIKYIIIPAIDTDIYHINDIASKLMLGYRNAIHSIL